MSHNARPLNRQDYKTLTLAALGGALEFYDFIIFVFFAAVVGELFFPADIPEWLRQVQTFGIFAAGYLARPLGGIIMAHFGDLVGRKKMFTLSILLMAVPTLAIGLLPTYASMGILAPLLLLLMRVLQGAAIGGEVPGAWVFVAEHVPARRIGIACGTLTAGLTVGILLGSVVATIVNTSMTQQAVHDWGWRIPFLFGCLIVPFIFILRRKLEETQEFTARRHHLAMRQVFATLLANWQVVIAGMMMVAMTTTAFYLITVYAPTFGKKVLMLSASDSLLVTLLVAISNFFWLPVGGALSDRFGRRSVLIAMTLLALATAWPALTMLANAPSFLMMLSVLLWLSFIYGMYNGAMIPALTEIMPAEVRVAGFSLAYSLATAVFGGFTPVISTALIEYTGDKASPGYWMSFAAICGLLATCYLYRRSAVALQTAR